MPKSRPGQAAPVFAFDVHALAEGEDLVLVVTNARGADLPEPATVIAIACLEAALGRGAVRTGAAFALRRPAAALARALLPGVGARVPSTEGVRWAALGADGGTWILHAAIGADAATPTAEARSGPAKWPPCFSTATRPCSAAIRRPRASGTSRPSNARRAMPKSRRASSRSTRVRSGGPRPPSRPWPSSAGSATELNFGVAPGELLLQIGDVDGALASFERAGEAERAPALAARAFELAARATRDAEAAARWLDRALARAPRSASARWARIDARLELGRLEDAVADVEHLEALARGARGKYAVWLRAGRAWEAKGMKAHAGAIFERALRYAPDEPDALTGLGAALVADGREERGVSLLARALELARARAEGESADLARAGEGAGGAPRRFADRRRTRRRHPVPMPSRPLWREDSRDDGEPASATWPARPSRSRGCATWPRRGRPARTTRVRERSSRCSSRPPRWSDASDAIRSPRSDTSRSLSHSSRITPPRDAPTARLGLLVRSAASAGAHERENETVDFDDEEPSGPQASQLHPRGAPRPSVARS